MRASVIRNGVRKFGIAAVTFVCAVSLTACGEYDAYSAAFKKITVNGGFDADITAMVTMDGESNSYSGNIKVDNDSNALYYEMSTDGEMTTQFSDGSYLYTSRGSEKVKYSLSGTESASNPSATDDSGGEQEKSPEFSTTDFLDEFAGFLDAGKIKELGILDPIPKAAVTSCTKDGSTYTIKVADDIFENFVNTMAENEADVDSTIQISDLNNFTCKATESDGVIVSTSYEGEMTVNVPGSLMSDGNDKDYALDFTIDIEYNDPGEAVTVTLPDAADYTEVTNE